MNMQSNKSQNIVARLLLVIFLLESCTNFNLSPYSQPEKATKTPLTYSINLEQIGTSSLMEKKPTPNQLQPNEDQSLIELSSSTNNCQQIIEQKTTAIAKDNLREARLTNNNQAINLAQLMPNYQYKQLPIAKKLQIKKHLPTGHIMSTSKVHQIVSHQQQLAIKHGVIRQESRPSHTVADLLTDQVCIAQGGHQVKFKKQASGTLQAAVKENIPQGFAKKHILPVVTELGFSCSEAAVKSTAWQKHHINLVWQKPYSYVWVGNRGLSGGMMEEHEEHEEHKGSLPSQKEKQRVGNDRIPSLAHSAPQWGLSKREIEYLFKNSRDLVCILEFGGHFKRVNQAWSDLLGWDIQELLDVPYINFIHPHDVEKTIAFEKDFAPIGLVNRYRCKDGTYCWIDWIGLAQTKEEEIEQRKNHYPLTIGRNITLRKLLEEKEKNHQEKITNYKLKQEEAQAVALVKSNFLAHMSHEIRTPLTGLLGLLELINKDHLGEEDVNYLQLARNSGLYLLSILNDILDVSKIEENQVKIESIQFNPLSIVQEVVQVLGLQAKEKGIKLNLTTSSQVPINLVGDPTRFRQILFNLIGNSVKFTSTGTVLVSIDGNDTNDHFTLIGDVIDTGIGISPEIQGSLFTTFFQADESMLRRFGGTGLGLFISKKLCNLMKGDVNLVSSEEGKGSTFRFTVNLKKPQEVMVPINSSTIVLDQLPKARVLVVEDNLVNQTVLTSMLKKAGCLVTSVWNGQQAVEAVNAGEYDIVLMDGEMPVMDGLEATKKIRERFSANVLPIIGVTAHAMAEDREKFLGAGMNGYLTKPINKAGLFAEIRRCLAEKEQK